MDRYIGLDVHSASCTAGVSGMIQGNQVEFNSTTGIIRQLIFSSSRQNTAIQRACAS